MKGTPLLLPVCIAGLLMLWSTCNIYFSFKNGELPLVDWKTEHKRTFGLLWTMATLCILYPTYFATMFLGISISRLELTERNQTADSPWFSAVVLSILVVIITFCVRVTVTAWFPTNMHLPFQSLNGGPVAGAASLLLSFGIMAVIFSLIRRLSRENEKQADGR